MSVLTLLLWIVSVVVITRGGFNWCRCWARRVAW